MRQINVKKKTPAPPNSFEKPAKNPRIIISPTLKLTGLK